MTELHYSVEHARSAAVRRGAARSDLSAVRVPSSAIDVLHYDVEVKPYFDQ